MDQQDEHRSWTTPFESKESLEYLNRHQNLRSLDMSLLEMDDVEAKQIGEAVASQESLEQLTLKLNSELDEEKKSSPTSMWPMDSFLTAAFLGEHRKCPVETLVIAGSGTDGDIMRLGILPKVLRENTRIKEVFIKWHGDDGCSGEEMQELLGVLRNAKLDSLSLPSLVKWDFPESEDQGFLDAESFAQVVELVQHNTSIRKLELHIGECRGPRKAGDVINLDAFYKVLSSNSTIRSLYLKGPFCTPIAETEFSNWLRTTSSLQELQMEGDGDESSVPKLVFQALRDNKSLRTVEMEDFVFEDEDLDELLRSLKVNSTLQWIVFHPECGREKEVQEALEKNLPK